MVTISFGNSITCALEDYSSATKPRDKAGTLGMGLLKKLTLYFPYVAIEEDSVFENKNFKGLAEEKDAPEENDSVKDGSHVTNKEEKESATEEDIDFIVYLQGNGFTEQHAHGYD